MNSINQSQLLFSVGGHLDNYLINFLNTTSKISNDGSRLGLKYGVFNNQPKNMIKIMKGS